MKAAITQFFTHPEYKFSIATKLKALLRTQINEHILDKYTFENVKAEVLEIWIDTAPEIEKLQIQKMSQSAKNKYLSFVFLFPYHTIMVEESFKITIFIDEFFAGLAEIFLPYQIPTTDIEEIKKTVKSEVIENAAYLELSNPKLLLIRDIIKNTSLPNKEKVN
jgi:hypothetical protein